MVVARLAARFAKAPGARVAPIALAISTMLLAASFVTLHALGLSAPQIADRDLADFDASVQLQEPLRADSSAVLRLPALLERSGASAVAWALESLDLRQTGGDGAVIYYREADWQTSNLDTRYELRSGRWPDAIGEVAVSSRVADTAPDGRLVTMSGRTTFTITGVVEDRYARGGGVALGAPGTWSGQQWQELEPAFPSAAATLTVYWTGLDSGTALDALGAVVKATPEEVDATRLSLATRKSILAGGSGSLVDAYPLAYTVPALLVPVAMTAVVMVGGDRRARRATGALRMVGLRTREATVAVLAGSLVAALLAAALGVVVGASLTLAARPVLEAVATKPLGPYVVAVRPAIQILALVLATGGSWMATRAVHDRRTRATETTAFRLPSRPAFARQITIALGIIALIWTASSMRTLFDLVTLSVITVVLAALCAPTVVRAGLAVLGGADPRVRLARRQMEDGFRRVTTTTVLVVVTAGPALAMLVLVGSVQASAQAQLAGTVPDGQLEIATSDVLEAPPPRAVELIRSVAPSALVVQTYGLGSAGAPVTIREDGIGLVYAIDTLEALEAMCGSTSDAARTALRDGVVLLGSEPANSGRLWRGSTSPIAVLPATSAQCPGWERRIGAVVLAGTAAALGIPMHASGVILIGTTDVQERAAVKTLEDNGYPVSLVHFESPAASPAIPPAPLAAVGVTCLLAGSALASSGRTHRHALREAAPGLWALGIPRRWTAMVLVIQVGYVSSVSALLATGAAAIPTAIAAFALPDVEVSVPWAAVAGVFLIVALMPVLALVSSTRPAATRCGAD